MKDDPYDPDNPIWTDEDFARARPADEILPSHLARLLVRDASPGLKIGFAGQLSHARGLKLAA